MGGREKDQEGKKRRQEKAGAETKPLVDLTTRQTGNRQTENTSINTQGIMGKMGNNWSGVETITKTGETDQGVTLT